MENKFSSFEYIKNMIGGVIIFGVCISVFFSMGGILLTFGFSPDSDDSAINIILAIMRLIILLLSLEGLFITAHSGYKLYAEKTGLENHAKGLTVFGIVNALILLVLQLLFWSEFIIVGILVTNPELFGTNVKVEGSAGVFGVIFIVVASVLALNSVRNAVKQIKRAKLSYTFDDFDLSDKEVEIFEHKEEK